MPSVNLTNMTSIRSWDEARTYWEANPPSKTRSRWPENSVALDGWRKPHVRLSHSIATDQFSCELYNTAMVRYRPSGEVLVVLNNHRTSIDFLRKTLPVGLEVRCAAGGVWLEVPQDSGKKVHVSPLGSGGIHLYPNTGTTGTWTIATPVRTRKVVLVQHRKIAGLEKRCAPVKEWLRTVHRLAGTESFHCVTLTNQPQNLEDALDDQRRWDRLAEYAPSDVVVAVAASSGLIKVVNPAEVDIKRIHRPDARWVRRLPPLFHYPEMAFV